MENEKKLFRQLKREMKKAGNRGRRNYLKRQLRDNPEEAHWAEYDFGSDATEPMNGLYPDTKREKDE